MAILAARRILQPEMLSWRGLSRLTNNGGNKQKAPGSRKEPGARGRRKSDLSSYFSQIEIAPLIIASKRCRNAFIRGFS